MTDAPHSRSTLELAQPGCMLEGVTQLLAGMAGEFRVALHADADCANLVPRPSEGGDPRRFYCTNLSEEHLIRGTAHDRLEQLVRALDGSGDVEVIFLVGSCVASLIGDGVEEAALRLQPRVEARLIPLETSAFALSGQVHIINHLTGQLARLAAPNPAEPRASGAVSLVGFPPDDQGELERILGALGVPVQVRLGLDSPLERWGALGGGALTVVPDARLFRDLLEGQAQEAGAEWLEVAPPYGLQAADTWVAAVLEAVTGAAPDERDPRWSALRQPATNARADLGDAWRGRRLLYHVGARKDFALQTLVRDGLGPLGLFEELGFDLQLAFQGAPEAGTRRRVQEALEAWGVSRPFTVLPDRVSLTRHLQQGGFEAVFCSDSLHEEVARAGAVHLPARRVRSGYQGAVETLRWLRARLDGGRPS